MSIQVTLSFASEAELIAYFAQRTPKIAASAPAWAEPITAPLPILEKTLADTAKTLAEPLPNEEDEPFEEPANDNANPTAEDVAAALTKYGKTNGAVALKAVLDKFEAKRLSEIKPEDYAAVMTAVGA